MATVSGFGRFSDSSVLVSNILNYVHMRVISNFECSVLYGHDYVTTNNICAEGEDDENQSTCQGGELLIFLLIDYVCTFVS